MQYITLYIYCIDMYDLYWCMFKCIYVYVYMQMYVHFYRFPIADFRFLLPTVCSPLHVSCGCLRPELMNLSNSASFAFLVNFHAHRRALCSPSGAAGVVIHCRSLADDAGLEGPPVHFWNILLIWHGFPWLPTVSIKWLSFYGILDYKETCVAHAESFAICM